MKNSLERRILTFSLLALILTVAINTLFNVYSFRRSYRDGILQRAQTFAEALKAGNWAAIRPHLVTAIGVVLEPRYGRLPPCPTAKRSAAYSHPLATDVAG